MDFGERFSFGINLDDPWRYAGFQEPRSVIFPHLLSLSLRDRGDFERSEEAVLMQHHQPIPPSEALRASLALADSLKGIGVDFVRCWFPWKYFEPMLLPPDEVDAVGEAGYSEWPLDALVDALGQQGISTLPVLACGYERMLPQGLSPDLGREEYLKRAYAHAKAVVKHLKDRVKTWQIENEPNWWRMHEAGGWRSGAAWIEAGSFRDELLDALNRAVHEEDPSALTMVNLEADQEISNVSEYARFCDLLGLDFYPNYKSPEPVNPAILGRADALASASGKPAMVAETGYPSGPSILGYSTDKQARYLELAVREAHSLERVTAIGIWRYLDTSWRSFPPQENHFGLVDENTGPKEAWSRYGEVIKELKG